jgi:hypothetical protein
MRNVSSTIEEPKEVVLTPPKIDLSVKTASLGEYPQESANEHSPGPPEPEVAKDIIERSVESIHSFQCYPFVAQHIPCPGVVKDLNHLSTSASEPLLLQE